jgi:5-methylcytosine-specific restriction endonuclease McrA
MARRSLRPHLNQIRSWVRQGRTDAWVAHQLEVTVQEIEQFKRQNDLLGDDSPSEGTSASDSYPDEIDLRAEDDELIAAELEAAMEAERVKAEESAQERARASAEADEEDVSPTTARRRRGRRGRRSSARDSAPLEGTFDHGEEGYGLWLDPAVQDNPIYAEHWAGHRPVQVTIEEDQIVIRRAGEAER